MLSVSNTQCTIAPALRYFGAMVHTCVGRLDRRSIPWIRAKPMTTKCGCAVGIDTGSSLLTNSTSCVLMAQVRNYDSCIRDDPPPCGDKNMGKNPCGKTEKPKEKKEKKKKTSAAKDSMWYDPECEFEPCEMPYQRYDVEFYRISDKRKRKYQVTWDECPRLIIKPKKVCVSDGVKRKIKRRKRAVLKPRCNPVKPLPCPELGAGKVCPKIVLPGCKSARNPPTCQVGRMRKKCKKIKTPYPSFSECQREATIPAPPNECNCLDSISLCEAWAALRRRLAQGRSCFKCGSP